MAIVIKFIDIVSARAVLEKALKAPGSQKADAAQRILEDRDLLLKFARIRVQRLQKRIAQKV